MSVILLLISCSGKTVLYVDDPHFDYFGSYSNSFYKIRKTFSFLKEGFKVNFIDPAESENLSLEVQEALESGTYDALVTSYLNYYSLEIPEHIQIVLIGGSEGITYPSGSQVVSSDLEALSSVSSELHRLWKDEGITPLTIFWEKPVYSEKERMILESSWDEKSIDVLKDNWINLDINSVNSESRLEEFFKRYDFTGSKYILFAFCPPVYKELMRSIPKDPELLLILSIPDNPVLPKNTYGIITEDYLGLISAAVRALKEDSPGEIRKVENKFIKK